MCRDRQQLPAIDNGPGSPTRAPVATNPTGHPPFVGSTVTGSTLCSTTIAVQGYFLFASKGFNGNGQVGWQG